MFKAGDKIRRIKKDWKDIKKGNIYTVIRCTADGSYWDLVLEESEWFADCALFELVGKITKHVVETKLP